MSIKINSKLNRHSLMAILNFDSNRHWHSFNTHIHTMILPTRIQSNVLNHFFFFVKRFVFKDKRCQLKRKKYPKGRRMKFGVK